MRAFSLVLVSYFEAFYNDLFQTFQKMSLKQDRMQSILSELQWNI